MKIKFLEAEQGLWPFSHSHEASPPRFVRFKVVPHVVKKMYSLCSGLKNESHN